MHLEIPRIHARVRTHAQAALERPGGQLLHAGMQGRLDTLNPDALVGEEYPDDLPGLRPGGEQEQQCEYQANGHDKYNVRGKWAVGQGGYNCGSSFV